MDICVSKLSIDVTEDDRREVFESFGRVERADKVRPREPVFGACRPRCRWRAAESAAGHARPIRK